MALCTEGGTEASVCRQCSPLPLPQQVLRASADSVKDCSSSGDRFSAPEMHCKRNTCLQAFARTSQSLSSHNPVRYCTWGACGIHNRSCSQKTSPQAPKWGQQLSPPPLSPFWVGSMNAQMFTITGNKWSAITAIIICFIQQMHIPRTTLGQS